MADIFIGTSGYIYPHWRGFFYPRGLPQRAWLAHYANHFQTVELNTTFYGLPKEDTVRAWRDAVPEGFLFAVKASRFITHVKRLREVAEPLRNLFSRMELLEDHLGPVLYQLPPGWGCNLERLRSFLALLPKGRLHAFEFRDADWLREEVREALAERGCAWCEHDMGDLGSPPWPPGPFVYIRRHGPWGDYSGSYSEGELKALAKTARRHSRAGRPVYIYFNNDQLAYAAKNALTLKESLASSRRETRGYTLGQGGHFKKGFS